MGRYVQDWLTVAIEKKLDLIDLIILEAVSSGVSDKQAICAVIPGEYTHPNIDMRLEKLINWFHYLQYRHDRGYALTGKALNELFFASSRRPRLIATSQPVEIQVVMLQEIIPAGLTVAHIAALSYMFDPDRTENDTFLRTVNRLLRECLQCKTEVVESAIEGTSDNLSVAVKLTPLGERLVQAFRSLSTVD